jgi:hypothetical protein
MIEPTTVLAIGVGGSSRRSLLALHKARSPRSDRTAPFARREIGSEDMNDLRSEVRFSSVSCECFKSLPPVARPYTLDAHEAEFGEKFEASHLTAPEKRWRAP